MHISEIVISTLCFCVTILLGANAFFLQNLYKKIEKSSQMSNSNELKIEMLGNQTNEFKASFKQLAEELSNIDRELSMLRYIVTKLGNTQS